jgi:Mn-dependent DtxR family transcriptional regulator
LFRDSRELTSKDIGDLFGFKPRTAAELCQRWVEDGFVEMANSSKRSRRYRLSPQYESIVDEGSL